MYRASSNEAGSNYVVRSIGPSKQKVPDYRISELISPHERELGPALHDHNLCAMWCDELVSKGHSVIVFAGTKRGTACAAERIAILLSQYGMLLVLTHSIH
jgi:hypothetical protein